MTKDEILARLQELKAQYWDWAYDIPLPHGVWTRGSENVPHFRLQRLVQTAADLSRKPLAECRVLDLGCLDGQFSIEFAQHGAEVIGIEVREANIKKAEFARDALGLDRLRFVQDDVRNLTAETYGTFDIVLCSGLLYHLATPDVFHALARMYEVTDRLLIVDTHISLSPRVAVDHDGQTYHGHHFQEHHTADSQEQRTKRLWASIDNPTSFWFSRPSLVNLLARLGFSSVHECLWPANLNTGSGPGSRPDRCTLIAVKGAPTALHTSPAANGVHPEWPEGTLSYPLDTPSSQAKARLRRVLGRIYRKIRPGAR